MEIRDFLENKKRPVITIGPDNSLLDAVKKLVDHNIGALPVCNEKGKILGIVSERDLLRECSKHVADIRSIKVQDAMTENIAISVINDDVNYVMDVMAQMNIRHLPIMDGEKLQGMISARDIIESQLEESKAKIRFLNDYNKLLSAIIQNM